MNNIVSQIKINNIKHHIASSAFGVCSTANNNSVKEVIFEDNSIIGLNTLTIGTTIHVKFINSNTSTNPVLKISGTDYQINIYKYGTTPPGITPETSWYSGAVVSLTYDGNAWLMNDYLQIDEGEEEDQILPGDSASLVTVNSSSSGGSALTYSRSDHTHDLSASTGTIDGTIKIGNEAIAVKGLKNSAYTDIANSINENDTRQNVLTTPKAVADYVASQQPIIPVVPNNSFGIISSQNQTSVSADQNMDTLSLIAGSYTSIILNQNNKSVTIASTLENKTAAQDGNEITLVTTGDKWNWDNNVAPITITEWITGNDNSDIPGSTNKKMIIAPKLSTGDLPDTIPPQFTLSIRYNDLNGDLQFFRKSSTQPDPDDPSTLTIEYDPSSGTDADSIDGAGKIYVRFNSGGE